MANGSKVEFPSIEGIHVLSLIGKGNFSHVYKGVQLADREQVAVKVINKNDLSKGKVDIIISEIGIMKSLNHSHIVKMMDFKWDDKAVYIILEYCEGGNLSEYIKSKYRLKENLVKRALQQLASGLAYLREKDICHMDLKPQNILIKFNPFTLKIADFGLAQYVPEKYYNDSLRGSPVYMAPEILLTDKYNSKVDLWSVGIILYECLYGRAPLAHKNWQELIDSLKKETPIKYPCTVPLSNNCKDLLERLLTKNPDNRISYDDFFEHPFIDLAHAPTDENKKRALKIINEAVRYDEGKDYVKAFHTYSRALRYLVPLLETMTASEERAYFQLKISEYLARAEELKSVLFKENQFKTGSKNASNEGAVRDIEKLVSKGNKDITSLISSDLSESESSSVSTGSIVDDVTSMEKFVPVQTGDSRSSEHYSSLSSEGSSSVDTIKSLPEDLFSAQSIKQTFNNSPKIHSALDIGFSGQMYLLEGDYETAYLKYETALSILISEVRNFPPGPKREFLLLQIRKWLTEAEGAQTLGSAKSVQLSGNVKHGVEVLESSTAHIVRDEIGATAKYRLIGLHSFCFLLLLASLLIIQRSKYCDTICYYFSTICYLFN